MTLADATLHDPEVTRLWADEAERILRECVRTQFQGDAGRAAYDRARRFLWSGALEAEMGEAA